MKPALLVGYVLALILFAVLCVEMLNRNQVDPDPQPTVQYFDIFDLAWKDLGFNEEVRLTNDSILITETEPSEYDGYDYVLTGSSLENGVELCTWVAVLTFRNKEYAFKVEGSSADCYNPPEEEIEMLEHPDMYIYMNIDGLRLRFGYQ